MRIAAPVLAALMLAGACNSAEAGLFQKKAPPSMAQAIDKAVNEIQKALDEQRLLDAGRLLDEALIQGMKDPRLSLLGGEIDLSRGRYEDSLESLKEAEQDQALQARAMQDEGIALSMLGRSDKAMAALQKAVMKDPTAWRAWNALGSEYDAHSEWDKAEQAYGKAITTSGGAAIALNNRGYSRLLQRRRDDAVADLVAALKKKPDLAEARTNLRLALAMGGDYDRAIAGGAPGDQAALLNNAGFAAAMRGDYVHAEDLLTRALKVKGEYYGRASENLKIVQALAAENQKAPKAAP